MPSALAGGPELRIGKINYISVNLKATCQLHRTCSFYVTVKPGEDKPALCHLLRWLHSAHAEGLSHEDHLKAAKRLKQECFGMKVRKAS